MKKSSLANCVLGLSLIIFTCFLTSCASTKGVEEVVAQKPDSITYERMYEQLEYLTTTIYYPVIGDYKDLNTKIEELVKENWTVFKDWAKVNWDGESSPYEYTSRTDVRTRNNIISVKISNKEKLSKDNYNATVTTLCFNKDKKKFLSISDVNPYSVEELSKLCKESLINSYVNAKRFHFSDEVKTDFINKIEEVTSPSIENFENFDLEGDDLCIYFNGILPINPYDDVAKATIHLK